VDFQEYYEIKMLANGTGYDEVAKEHEFRNFMKQKKQEQIKSLVDNGQENIYKRLRRA